MSKIVTTIALIMAFSFGCAEERAWDGTLYRVNVYHQDDMKLHKTYENIRSWDRKWYNELILVTENGGEVAIKGFHIAFDTEVMASGDAEKDGKWDRN